MPASRTRPKGAVEDRRGDTTAQQLRDPGKADAAARSSQQGAVTGEDVAQAVGLPTAQRLGRRAARTSPAGETTVAEWRGLVRGPAVRDPATGRGLLVRDRRAGRGGVGLFQGLPPALFGRPSGGRGPAGGLLGPADETGVGLRGPDPFHPVQGHGPGGTEVRVGEQRVGFTEQVADHRGRPTAAAQVGDGE